MSRASLLFLSLTFVLGSLAGSTRAGTVQVNSTTIKIVGDDANHTAVIRRADNALLLYDPGYTSHFVFNLNGTLKDMQDPATVIQPLTATGSGLGAKLESAKSFGNFQYGVRYTVVADPRDGTGDGFVEIRLWVKNTGGLTLPVGARLMLDVALLSNAIDETALSPDNGFSTYLSNTMIPRSGGVPSDWWAYDQFPSPSIIGRGVTWGNQFGQPATQPDAVEFAHWDEIEASAFYLTHDDPGEPFANYTHRDTAVVLWWTGTGLPETASIMVAPGQTQEFITYYGLQTKPLQQTLTPYVTYTDTPTVSPTPTITATHTISPTFSVSPTRTPTHTISPTFSFSPTRTATFTRSPSYTASPTFSFSPTRTATPSITVSFTASPTATHSPTITVSPTITATFSVSQTFTFSPTRTITLTPLPTPPILLLTPKPPNPNPSDGAGVFLPYVLTRDATVTITVYTVAGEKVRGLEPYAARPGPNEQYWDQRNDSGAKVASGVFIYSIVAVAGDERQKTFMKLAVVR